MSSFSVIDRAERRDPRPDTALGLVEQRTQFLGVEALDHLTDRGIIVAQFGEYDFEGRPNRTARYVSTAYAALDESGVDNPNQHLMVSTSSDYPAQLSTIVVKRLPFDDTETGRFTAHADATPGTTVRYTPELRGFGETVGIVASVGHDQWGAAFPDYPYNLSPVRDNAPFFWHFQDFGDVLTGLFDPVDPARDPEVAVGERVLVLLLVVSILFPTVFLLLPFALVRRDWSDLPRRGASFGYFAALGVARLSLGSALARATWRTIHDAGQAMFTEGRFDPLQDALPFATVNPMLT